MVLELSCISGHLVDVHHRLQLDRIAEADFGHPERAADMTPAVQAPRRLHGACLVRAERAVGLEGDAAESARAAQPSPGRYRLDAVACLVDAHIAAVAEDHLVVALGVGRTAHIANDLLIELDVIVLQVLEKGLHVAVALGLEQLDQLLEFVRCQRLFAHPDQMLIYLYKPLVICLVVVIL